MKVKFVYKVIVEGEVDDPATEGKLARAKDQMLGKFYSDSLITEWCEIEVKHAELIPASVTTA